MKKIGSVTGALALSLQSPAQDLNQRNENKLPVLFASMPMTQVTKE